MVSPQRINSVGAIWRGSANNFGPKQWTFGQFEEGVLDVVCRLLENDHRVSTAATGSKLSDLVQIVRILSSAANSCDLEHNDGILQGNWTGDYRKVFRSEFMQILYLTIFKGYGN